MTQRAKRGLKFAAAAFFAALLVAITINAAVDSWTPQVELKNPAPPKEAAAPAVEPASLQVPLAARPLPAPPWPEQPAAKQAQPQWNQPLFEPKFDGPGVARSGGGAQTFTAPDFSNVLNQYAPLSQVLPPSVSPGSGPAPVSIRPIFGGKSGGVEGGALDAAGGLTGTAGSTVGGTVGGVTSGASSLLKR